MPNCGNKTKIMGGNILPDWLDKGQLTTGTVVFHHQDV